MFSHPEQVARSRYSQSFQSKIFEPEPVKGNRVQPAGKRRDQSTAELFGNYEAKEDLRSMPKTFRPKEDECSAWEKKQQFLSSHMLSECQHKSEQRGRGQADSEAGYVQQVKPAFDPYAEEEQVDSNARRQEELKSKLFGRPTPAALSPRMQSGNTKLTPNDFNWHSHPEQRGSRGPHTARGEMSHTDRAYQEKCSNVFDHRSPQVQQQWGEAQKQLAEEEMQGDAKRRNDVYYSDLFGRDTGHGEARRPRTQNGTGAEEKIIVHQDWTNSKTELMHHRDSRAEHPHQRKSEELHRVRIFGGSDADSSYQRAERLEPVTHDNSDKLKSARGRGTQHIHQAHLKTSIAPNEFYEQAESARHWEVAEIHLSGLGRDANDEYVRDLCHGSDVQLVKVAAEVDPVRNLCRGRAKVTVRYNPKRDSIDGLVRKFEDCNLKVEM